MSDSIYKRCKCRGADKKDVGAGCLKLKRKDGSWNPKHGTWYFALELPPGPEGKRRPRMRRGGFDSKEAAEAAREKAKETLRKGADPSERVKLGEYLTKWLANRPDLKPSTRHGYEVNISTYLIPLLGHIYLGRLTPDDIAGAFTTIREWNADLAEGRPVRKYQRHVGPAAMQRIRATLRVALNDAYDAGRIPANPADRVRMESEEKRKPVVWTAERVKAFRRAYQGRLDEERAAGRTPRTLHIWRDMTLRPAPVMVWTTTDAGRFLDYVRGHRLSAMFELALDTGMRRGEVCGLRWVDVDLEELEVHVVVQRVQVAWKVLEGTPKSEAGRRVVHFTAATGRALRALRKRQMEDRLSWGEAWTETGLAFTHEDGTALHPAAITDLFERQAMAAGMPPIRFHDVRHISGTVANAAGVGLKVTSERLGHSTTKLTADTYTSVYPEIGRAAAEKIAAMIPREASW